jgi:hypothetical protein
VHCDSFGIFGVRRERESDEDIFGNARGMGSAFSPSDVAVGIHIEATVQLSCMMDYIPYFEPWDKKND